MLVLLAATASAATSPIRPTTTNNDDSCDIALQPAATLLLPYFEVDFRSPQTTARSTIFTIVNTSPLPQIVHVTLWTDWSFPALDFKIFMPGYEVQGINLYDIFERATIAPGAVSGTGGTSSNTTVPTNPTAGSQPAQNDANPNISSLAFCAEIFPAVSHCRCPCPLLANPLQATYANASFSLLVRPAASVGRSRSRARASARPSCCMY